MERTYGHIEDDRTDACGRARRPGLLRQLREDYAVNGSDWTKPGFRALAVHRFGIWCKGLRWKILRWPLWRVYLVLFRYVRNHYGIEIPLSVEIGRRVMLGHQHGIVFHPLAKVGDGCIIRHNVTIGAHSLKQNRLVPTLGNNVEIGCGATIIGGIHVGDGASVGANTLVRTDVPPGALAVGNPARIIERGNEETPASSRGTEST